MKKFLSIIILFQVLASSCAKDIQEVLPDAPAVPAELTATSTSDSSVRFGWTASESAEYYNWVVRDRHFNVVDLGKTERTTVEVSDLRKGDRYTFAVRAAKGLSVSGYSDFVIGIPGGTYIPVQPARPSDVTCTSQEETALGFKWSAALDAKQYEYILQDDKKSEVRRDTTDRTFVTLDDLSKGMIYFFRVKSLNDGKESSYSSTAMGVAGGKYTPDRMRLLFLSAPDGILWKQGDRVQATVGSSTIDYICESDSSSTGLFWPESGAEVPAFGNARIVFPSGLQTIPSSGTENFRLPMAANSNGISAVMTPLCKKLTMSITSDQVCEAAEISLSGDKPFSGNCSIDWTGSEPKIIIVGSEGLTLDLSNAPRALDANPTEVFFPVPVYEYGKVNVKVKPTEGESIMTIVEGGLNMTSGSKASCIVPDANDFFSLWRSGNSFTICNDTISKATYPEAKLLNANAINTAFETSGLYFADNSQSERTWTYSAERRKQMAAGTILIGRYKNYPQPVMKQDFATNLQGYFNFAGDVKILNYRIEARDNTYGVFQGRSGVDKSGKDTFLFQDCTFINSNKYLTSFNNGSYAVPKVIRFDNCIIRVQGTVVYGGSNANGKPEALETLSFNNTVIAPYDATSPTSANGCLFNFGSTVNATTKLNIEMNYCTIYEYQPKDKTRGIVEVKDYADFKMERVAFYHSSYESFTASYYTIYGIAASTMTTGGVSIKASYANSIAGQTLRHSGGNKSYLAPSPRSWSATINAASQTVDTSKVNPEKDYFPVEGINAGAEYTSKYWINNQ